MMTTKLYILGEGQEKEVRFDRPKEKHEEREVSYYLRDKLLQCATEEVQQVINEILSQG